MVEKTVGRDSNFSNFFLPTEKVTAFHPYLTLHPPVYPEYFLHVNINLEKGGGGNVLETTLK